MSNIQRTNGKYLWWSLLGLGFQPEVAVSSGASKANVKHIILGPNMFDKPNKDAFYIVTHFLLEKLNPTRFHDTYRHCWPVLDHKADAEFRKVTYAWLRDLMDEQGSTIPKVVASLFLSPGGPKFVNLMLHLANYVEFQEMQTFSTDGTWVPEAAAAPASSVQMALKRFQLVKTRFLRGAVEQDRILHEYERQAQSQVKSLRDLRAEDAKYNDLLKRHKNEADKEETLQAEKIQKVRSLWSSIDGVLSTLEEERRVLECVIGGGVDQYTLDGTGLALKIPRVLLERIEQLSHLSSVGSVYEADQLNLLSMLELLHQALGLLVEERVKMAGHTPIAQLHPLLLQERNLQMARALEDLRLMRKRISKEEIPEVKSVIRKLETEWDQKWADCLKRTPLTLFLNEDPALDFLCPMAPLSFEPATEASFKSSVFSQYPATLPKFSEEKLAETDSIPMDSALKRLCPLAVERVASRLPSVVSSPLTPLHALCETPLAVPVKAPSPSPLPASVRKTPCASLKMSAVKREAQILDSEFDNLANQFAEAVTTSPGNGSLQGLALGDLLCNLGTDPFSTRKQIPRTPESLILDVRSSWRRAVEEGEAQKARLSDKFDGDGIFRHLTALCEVQETSLSPDVHSLSTGLDPTNAGCSTAAPEQASLMSTLPWDCSNTEALHSLSSSDVIQFRIDQEAIPEQFSIDQETLPELPGNDGSFLSSSDTSNTEEEELLLPHIPSLLPTETEPALLVSSRRLDKIQQTFREASSMDRHQGAQEMSPPQHDERSLDARDWLMAMSLETAATVGATDKVFSLDLDTLESPSPPRKEQFSLSQLLTFSPIEDL
ncbi:HAUS augmin-like complex subunit 6 isoform X1 [Oncorhynchus mykiss]|uniref:HAUS augmin-like complex subunit 6 N-terminal domain-containing protein n=1 Tax=Oncorhynchus mykiss TaxID=8022 RepID=A0A8C7NM02_ONCMY|nr:HAUS augmin-like complex subunit 6 isoform X1 [Oncorhynchus mykiss]